MRQPSRGARAVAVRTLAVVVTAGAVWVITRGLDRAALAAALRSARWGPLFLTSALAVSHLCLRGVGWHVILGPVSGASVFKNVRYTIASAAASLVAPFRTAEVLRPWLLRRNHGVPLAQSAGAMVADKVVEALALAILALPLPLLGRRLPLSRTQGTVICAVVAAAALIGFLGAGRLFARGGRVGKFIASIRVLSEPRRFALALAISIVAWLIDLAAIATTLLALGIRPAIADAMMLLLSVNLALLLPSAPGNIGSVELGATLGAVYVGVPHPQALAFALIYHAAQLAPLILIALFGLVEAVVRKDLRKDLRKDGAKG
jgi:uncharacterized membrane protein YbhN (UPF0104 family)